MKNLTFTGILTIGFVFVISLFSTREVVAQRYLSEIKSSTEIKGITDFAESLAEFYLIGDSIAKINTGKGTAEPDKNLLDKFAAAAKKVKDGARLFTKNADSLARRLPSSFSKGDPAQEGLKEEIKQLLGSRNAEGFFNKHGGNYVLAIAGRDITVGRINSDIDSITAAPLKLGFNKLKFPCAVLASAVLATELRKTTKTAATVDSFFKSICSSSSSVTQ